MCIFYSHVYCRCAYFYFFISSHVHCPLKMDFLECPPDIGDPEMYVDDAELFYMSPIAWLNAEFHDATRLPTHLVMFSALEKVRIAKCLTDLEK